MNMTYDQVKSLYEAYLSLRESPNIEWVLEEKDDGRDETES